MQREFQPAVYLLTNRRNGAIYTGVTSRLIQRIHEHREGAVAGFTREHGIKRLDPTGEKFDPNRHDAVALVPVTDAAKDGMVIDVMREGYLIGEHTLRPASVAVGKQS